MNEFLNKLKSRKFVTCIIGIIMGACMTFGVDAEAVDVIAGAIVTVGSVMTYIYTEGKIDATAVDKIKDAVDDVKDAIDVIEEIEE